MDSAERAARQIHDDWLYDIAGDEQDTQNRIDHIAETIRAEYKPLTQAMTGIEDPAAWRRRMEGNLRLAFDALKALGLKENSIYHSIKAAVDEITPKEPPHA